MGWQLHRQQPCLLHLNISLQIMMLNKPTRALVQHPHTCALVQHTPQGRRQRPCFPPAPAAVRSVPALPEHSRRNCGDQRGPVFQHCGESAQSSPPGLPSPRAVFSLLRQRRGWLAAAAVNLLLMSLTFPPRRKLFSGRGECGHNIVL